MNDLNIPCICAIVSFVKWAHSEKGCLQPRAPKIQVRVKVRHLNSFQSTPLSKGSWFFRCPCSAQKGQVKLRWLIKVLVLLYVTRQMFSTSLYHRSYFDRYAYCPRKLLLDYVFRAFVFDEGFDHCSISFRISSDWSISISVRNKTHLR